MAIASNHVVLGRTRWRRFALLLGPAIALAGLMVYLAMTGAFALSFAASGIPFKLSASNLSGTGFTQYAVPDPVTNGAAAAGLLPSGSTGVVGGTTYVADTVTVLGSADITALHQTICAPLPGPLGAVLHNMLVTIDAGGKGTPAHADNLAVNAPLLTASDATFTNINIGQDLGQALGGATNGQFSQHASSVSINGLNQLAVGTNAGSFKLTDLNLAATFTAACP